MTTQKWKSAAVFWGAMDSVTYAYRSEFSQLSYQYFKIFRLLRLRERAMRWPENTRSLNSSALYSLGDLTQAVVRELKKSEDTARMRIDRLKDLGWISTIDDPSKRNKKRIMLTEPARRNFDVVEMRFLSLWQALNNDYAAHQAQQCLPTPADINQYWKKSRANDNAPLFWQVVDALDICIRANFRGIDHQFMKIIRLMRLVEIQEAFSMGEVSRLPELRYSVTDLTKEAISELRQTNVNIRTRIEHLIDLGLIGKQRDAVKQSKKRVMLTGRAHEKLVLMEAQFVTLFHQIRSETFAANTNFVHGLDDDLENIALIYNVTSLDHAIPHPTF